MRQDTPPNRARYVVTHTVCLSAIPTLPTSTVHTYRNYDTVRTESGGQKYNNSTSPIELCGACVVYSSAISSSAYLVGIAISSSYRLPWTAADNFICNIMSTVTFSTYMGVFLF